MYQIPKSTRTEVKLFLGLFFIDIAIIGGGVFFAIQTMNYVAGLWRIIYILAVAVLSIFMIVRYNGHRMYRVIYQAIKKDLKKYYAVMGGK
ncbi:hypothetical protein HCA55_17145 [Listeria booriae]|uniref:Uncharacterized protein n=1 Tax=Listeria booriae TaxID=1552123 RepID=A0A7X1DSN9_9LIST|nr:DUF5592 family protein [Listeria booriae]MBC1567226.1 hypothetical protein [Listeria booriae]MBC1798468.1 hypothetical protein [Listeria booriae]MBC2164830.1 hypothetical protein [Listeria booriae]MBC2373707.1 hypothetical protein [Listeria booriae]